MLSGFTQFPRAALQSIICPWQKFHLLRCQDLFHLSALLVHLHSPQVTPIFWEVPQVSSFSSNIFVSLPSVTLSPPCLSTFQTHLRLFLQHREHFYPSPIHSTSHFSWARPLSLAMCSGLSCPEVTSLSPDNPIQGHTFCQLSASSQSTECVLTSAHHPAVPCSPTLISITWQKLLPPSLLSVLSISPDTAAFPRFFCSATSPSLVTPLVSFFSASFSFVCFQTYIVLCIFYLSPFFIFP